ncbi:MAG: hypothetical protein KY464_14685 [Gemmatimonadetes bacterium]|nr:hypothetical protein [Gemmatimonadota bacterium]
MLRRSLSGLAVLLFASAGTAGAQSTLVDARSAVVPLPSHSALRPGDTELLSPAARAAVRQQGSLVGPRGLIYGAVGGLIGAGTGFMVSQVMRSDWDKATNSTFAAHRRSFALSGAALGSVTAFVVARAPSLATTVHARGAAQTREGSGGAISLQELTETSAQNAYDAVKALRPQWLVARGATLGSFGRIVVAGDETIEGPPNVSSTPGVGRIGAFLDGIALQDIEALKDIPIISIERIEFRTASVSASGPGHIQRAIVVISASGRSE